MTASPAEPAALPAWATLKAQLRTHLEQLAHDVDQTAADRGFLAMLDSAARLWRYSPLNQVFIHFQRRDATAVRPRCGPTASSAWSTWPATGGSTGRP